MKKLATPFIVGMALFAMFFGSGNLTFPLYVGKIAQQQWGIATIGFLLSGVLLPFLGILTMVFTNGNYHQLFEKYGKYFGGKWLIWIFLSVFIPLGGAPRCITVAYASIQPYIPFMPLWIFSLIFCAFIFILVSKPNRILSLLGYVLTPLLLISLALLIGSGFYTPSIMSSSKDMPIFFTSFIEGYNTMDMIAGCFFASSIMKLLSTKEKENQRLKLFLHSSFVGVILLAAVYIAMIALAAFHANALQGLGKEEFLPYLAQYLLGKKLGILSSVIVLLACITTLAALVYVFADFLQNSKIAFFRKGKRSLLMTFGLVYFMSLIGFANIGKILAPLLQVLYPILIVISFTCIIDNFRTKRAIRE